MRLRQAWTGWWSWGRTVYRVSTTTALLWNAYTNPWLVRGIMQVAWVVGRGAVALAW